MATRRHARDFQANKMWTLPKLLDLFLSAIMKPLLRNATRRKQRLVLEHQLNTLAQLTSIGIKDGYSKVTLDGKMPILPLVLRPSGALSRDRIGGIPEREPSNRIPYANVLDAYVAGRHQLAILGDPGSGKTVQALLLTRELLTSRAFGSDVPVPVPLQLSTWQGKHRSLEDWMASELSHRHRFISKRAALGSFDHGHLLPVLDGLDEVESASQRSCLLAIKKYLRSSARPPMVLCTREEAYRLLTAGTKDHLKLQLAVEVQPPDNEAICAYLEGSSRSQPRRLDQWGAVRAEVMNGRIALRRALDTPLKLQCVAVAFSSSEHVKPEEVERDLWQCYLKEVLSRDRHPALSKEEHQARALFVSEDFDIEGFLAWLAGHMDRDNDVYYERGRLKAYDYFWPMSYLKGVRGMTAAAGGASLALLTVMSASVGSGVAGTWGLGVLVGISSAVLLALSVTPEPTKRGDRDTLSSRVGQGLIVGLVVGSATAISVSVQAGLVAAAAVGFGGACPARSAIHIGWKARIGQRRPMQAIIESGRVGASAGLIVSMAIGLVFVPFFGFASGLRGVVAGLALGCGWGFLAALVNGCDAMLFYGMYGLYLHRRQSTPFRWTLLMDRLCDCAVFKSLGHSYEWIDPGLWEYCKPESTDWKLVDRR